MDGNGSTQLGGQDGQDSGAGAHVQHRLPFQGFPVFEQLRDDHRRGLVMAASEAHLRIDDDIVAGLRQVFVIDSLDRHFISHYDRLEVAFPYGIPILLLYQLHGM